MKKLSILSIFILGLTCVFAQNNDPRQTRLQGRQPENQLKKVEQTDNATPTPITLEDLLKTIEYDSTVVRNYFENKGYVNEKTKVDYSYITYQMKSKNTVIYTNPIKGTIKKANSHIYFIVDKQSHTPWSIGVDSLTLENYTAIINEFVIKGFVSENDDGELISDSYPGLSLADDDVGVSIYKY